MSEHATAHSVYVFDPSELQQLLFIQSREDCGHVDNNSTDDSIDIIQGLMADVNRADRPVVTLEALEPLAGFFVQIERHAFLIGLDQHG